MSDDRTVTFKLNGKRPDDFTIERLAQYLSALGDLVSSPGKVRVKKLTPGSVKVELAVERDHYPKFVERLTVAKNPARAPATLRKVVADLEEMVTADNVTAEVTAGRTKLLFLHGYVRATGPVVGPVIQRHAIRGQVIGLEGKDATKHVRIAEYGTGREVRGEFRDADLAGQLTKHLWKDVVELTGTARMLRHPDGTWEMKAFRVDGVEELQSVSPSQVVQALRQAFAGVDMGSDPVGDAKKIRG
ncbi:hypothetical protein N800_06770 [Lysobacter daejeonensis GH1-9]|uniref:Uncharacterized protein n=1 Tax=Lysobacter daejeonensis GH1-9 TaxID=1385517 RepID=A0A0A0EUQ0_9GAMM|nr:hypothetical protein [Lysobacter daejeonensis]KGM54676.1 hypothetical protein N800_06770 [Lysobacter daejeonensis GH1-9]